MKYRIIRLIAVIALFTVAITGAVYADNEAETTEAAEVTENVKNGGNVVFFLYHDLVDGELTDANNPEYCTTGEKFRSDLKTLIEAGWTSISSEHYLNGEYDADKNYFVVTFDDGYMSNYKIAFPILKELGVYADIFMCTSNVILSNHFKWKDGQTMEDSGLVTLYSHTTKHKDLTELGLESFLVTVERSMLSINERLSREHEAIFSYPGSDYSRESVERLYDLGVKLQFVQIMPPADADWDWASLGLTQRYNVAYSTDIMAMVNEAIGLTGLDV